jgi:hypothetical protein
MPLLQSDLDTHRKPATHEEVRSILGDLDPGKMIPIMELRPTVAEVEEATMWLAGDVDIFGAGPPLKRSGGTPCDHAVPSTV